jgi:hypothetical protein
MPQKRSKRIKAVERKDLSHVSRESRQLMIQAFTRYCQGETGPSICRDLAIPEGTYRFWQHSQNWREGRRRITLGLPPENPILDPDHYDKHTMPSTHEDLLIAITVTRDVIRSKLGDVLHDMAEAAIKRKGEDNLDKSADIQRLTAAYKNIFVDKDKEEDPKVSINITADGIRSVVVPDVVEYGTKLPIMDAELVDEDD